jgi:hypothetical protein
MADMGNRRIRERQRVTIKNMKAVSLASVFLFAKVAFATTMVPLDLRALTSRADRVVLGTVESQTSRWTDDHNAIYTEVTVRVARVYKGQLKAGDAVVVRREGGSVDGIGMRVHGAAEFAVGEEVLVFVEVRGAASWVVGMSQGKWRVETMPDGRRQVLPSTAGMHFVGDAQAQARAFEPRVLEDFESELRSVMATPRTRQ